MGRTICKENRDRLVIPKSISATALHVAELCPARFKAEHIDRSKGFGGTAASLGSAVHGALEYYVKRVYIDKAEQPSFKLLHDMFKLSYVEVFGSHNFETEEYMDGYGMLENWYKRQDFEGVEVLSCEVKSNFLVPCSVGEIPFNYIWDRFDYVGNDEYRVVDYKSNRWAIKPEDLKKKIQARAYGLAAAIQLKKEGVEPKRIWVEFDLLRHGPVGISFSRNDNAVTWRYIKRSLQEIIDTPEDKVEEKLNSECLFCVRKATCGALKKNIIVGGAHSIGSIEEAIDLRSQLDWQLKGLNSLIKDLDDRILLEAKERDIEEYESDTNRLKITVSSQRRVDAEMVELAIGPDLFRKYGGRNFAMGTVDKLLKGRELTAEQKKNLRSLIYNHYGDPRVKVEPRNPIDED